MGKNGKNRLVLSLGLNIAIVILTVVGTFGIMTGTVSDGAQLLHALGPAAFRYFTVDANLLMGISALISLLSLIGRLSGRRSEVPHRAEVLRLTAVSSVALAALVVAFYLAPEAALGFDSLYMGANLIFHGVTPVLAVAELLLRHSEKPVRFRENLFCLIPVTAYGIYYIVPWVIAGGAGYDWYGLLKDSTAENAFILLFLILMILLAVSVLFWCLTGNFDPAQVRAVRHREKNERYYESVSALEYYETRVIKLICAVAPAVALCAAAIFTTLTLTDRFEMSGLSLLFFDACCLAYLPAALYISDTSIGQDGIAIPSRIKLTKRLLTLLITLQWNLISYLAPFGEFWAYAFLFAAISALFLDRKTLLVNEVLIFVSMLLSWTIRGDVLLPPPGEKFLPDLILRFSAVLLSFILLYLLVLLIQKILLTALDRISEFDPLTHTLTRRRLLRTVEAALATYNRIWVPCCIAIFDLDDFKQINDTYGHITGDEVLREFARILYANVQSRDVIFRYGGEEFLILFFCPVNYAEASCHRILNQLRHNEFSFLPPGRQITCTAGISVSARDMTAQEFIELADKRLYAGKRAGKDRVVTE